MHALEKCTLLLEALTTSSKIGYEPAPAARAAPASASSPAAGAGAVPATAAGEAA